MRACKCPNCDANISLDDNQEFGFCQYCGAKIILDDYRSTRRVIDEAKIHESQTKRIIRLRELELKEKEAEKGRKGRKIAYFIALILFIVGLISCTMSGANMVGIYLCIGGALIAEFTFLGATDKKEKERVKENTRNGMIKLTSAAADYENKNYKYIESIYIQLGFKNVSALNLKDLRVGIIKKPGVVEEVTINGEEPEEDEWYSRNAKVIITYHGLSR